MKLEPMPAAASWVHAGLRTGFEVLFTEEHGDGHRLLGHTTAREGSAFWSVGYTIEVDLCWRTRAVQVWSSPGAGERSVRLERLDGDRWEVDGVTRPDLDGCVDVDLESSSVTNTLPIHRQQFVVGAAVEAPAAFVRAEDLRVERLEQRYTLTGRSEQALTFHYEAPVFDVECELTYDPAGLVVGYPGIAVRDR